jgi:Fe-S cluster biosynthesis and repair protein YggX
MARTVYCRKLKKELQGLATPPFPGPKGLDIFKNVSQEGWGEWLTHQTMLINEKHLNMMDKESRNYLADQRDKYLSGEKYDIAEGYVPPSQ